MCHSPSIRDWDGQALRMVIGHFFVADPRDNLTHDNGP